MSRFPNNVRERLRVRGAVQGVGFRPFVFRLANELGLSGWVRNSAAAVEIEIEGAATSVEEFVARLPREAPGAARIRGIERTPIEPRGAMGFEIRASADGAKSAVVLPDLAPCAECVRELFDPGNRRYRYPFISCAQCGPRYSIINAIPYDREQTTMRVFKMCAACRAEYEDPRDRRFHAQTNACAECGPRLEQVKNSIDLHKQHGQPTARLPVAHSGAVEALHAGQIVALKGIGGFQLLVDAYAPAAVERLRERKGRGEKPFAVMYAGIEDVERDCEIEACARELLLSPAAPIVLVPRRTAARLAANVAPENPLLGVMLPSSPLHHLLLRDFDGPVVATSGNVSDEPLCIENADARERLGGIADVFLMHDREIARRVDDSVLRTALGGPVMIRRARGYASLPIVLGEALPNSVALGAHQKSTVAIAVDEQVVLSPHIGDLDTPEARGAFSETVRQQQVLYARQPEYLACDAHPDYASSRFAETAEVRCVTVQHHYAHALSCMAENGAKAPALAVVWDGTGLGSDGTIWGGEFLVVQDCSFERAAYWRTFRLPGGEAAARDGRRAAAGILHEMGEDSPWRAWNAMLERGVNAPWTSSAGRLFDAVAALTGVRERSTFEGQAAMALEFAARGCDVEDSYPLAFEGAVMDWAPMLREMLRELRAGVSTSVIAAKFHRTLAEAVVLVARKVGLERVVLSGGCFQNTRLLESAVRQLRAAGFEVFWQRWVPCNDGGIALGQIVAGRETNGSPRRHREHGVHKQAEGDALKA